MSFQLFFGNRSTTAANVSISVDARDLSFSSFAPGILVNSNLVPTKIDLAFSSFAPSLFRADYINPEKIDLSFSTFAPDVLRQDNISPGANDLVFSFNIPILVVTDHLNLTPSVKDLVFSNSIPDVFTQDFITINPGKVDLSFSFFAPELIQTTSVSLIINNNNLNFNSSAPEMGILMFPDSDISDGGWTTESGGTNLSASIDEQILSDSDYIKSSPNPNNDVCEINLSNPNQAPNQPFEVFYRYKNSGEARLSLVVSLVQGTDVIATWTHDDVGLDFVTASQVLSGLEFNSISDFNDLRIRFTANAS